MKIRRPHKQPQLYMEKRDLRVLPPAPVPRGYLWHTYTPADQAAWCEIVEGNIGEGWSPDKFELSLLSAPQFDPEGTFMATFGGEAAGTCSAWRRKPDEKTVGILHMLAVKDVHRDKGLGTFLATKVVEYFCQRGFSVCSLTTDDERLPAIKIYLRLGFKPVCTHENHDNRWREVFRHLGLDPGHVLP